MATRPVSRGSHVSPEGEPPPAACDLCNHRHLCYVGGRAVVEPASGAIGWERHVCLGCLMRASRTDG